MSGESTEDDFQTPSTSKNSNVSLKRKSCPANVECKKAKTDLGTPLTASFASYGRLHRLTGSQLKQLKQRRLEFKTANSENIEKPERKESSVHRVTERRSKEELAEFIKKAEEELAARETHERKVKELKESICIWKNGLNRVLVDLQNKLPTHSNKRSILQQLQVPLSICEYVDDPDD